MPGQILLLGSALVLAVGQIHGEATSPSDEPEGDELPLVGQPLPLPAGISWAFQAPFQKTATRVRLPLDGLWRFLPVVDPRRPAQRSDMGWVRMPAVWHSPQAIVLDPQLRFTDGLWRGRPLSQYPCAWVEREIVTTGSWFKYRVFLAIEGPWADAQIWCVGLKVQGRRVGGRRWVELTEALAYPATNLLDMQLCLFADRLSLTVHDPGNIWLELVKSGPRIDWWHAKRNQEELTIEGEVIRPLGYPLLPSQARGAVVEAVIKPRMARSALFRKRLVLNELRFKPVAFKLSVPADLRMPGSERRADLQLLLLGADGTLFDQTFPVELSSFGSHNN